MPVNTAMMRERFRPIRVPQGLRTAKLWVPAVRDRLADFLTALGKAIDQHPALAHIVFPESALANNPDLKAQPTYTPDKMFASFRKTHEVAHASFPKTPVVQYVNWGTLGMTKAMRDDMMSHLVVTLKEGFGGPDTYNQAGGALNCRFGEYYDTYAGKTFIAMSNQPSGYTQKNAQFVFDHAVDRLGAHFMSWSPVMKSWKPDAVYDINDVIKEVNRQHGRVNTAPPPNVNPCSP